MPDPSDDELFAFVDTMLSNLDRELREPAVVAQAISDNRTLWVMLYSASFGLLLDDRNESSA